MCYSSVYYYLHRFYKEESYDSWDSVSDVSHNDPKVRINSVSHFFNKDFLRINLLRLLLALGIAAWLKRIGVFADFRDDVCPFCQIFNVIREYIGLFGFDEVLDDLPRFLRFFSEYFEGAV